MLVARMFLRSETRRASAGGHSKLRACLGIATAALLLVDAMPSRAQEGIGAARVVVNSVKGSLPSGSVTITQNDGVFRDEGLRTDSDSSAKLVLLDDTNLSIGPSSAVKLDRFVYAGPAQTGEIAIRLAKGILRFATGNADKRAYVITTPTAAIGVRGTVLKIVASPAKTIVVLEEGAARVCARGSAHKKGSCFDLTIPGERAVVTATRAREDRSPSDPTSTAFAALCGQGGVCVTTPFFIVSLPPFAPGPKGGGHGNASGGSPGGTGASSSGSAGSGTGTGGAGTGGAGTGGAGTGGTGGGGKA
jgi:hypothetical protein